MKNWVEKFTPKYEIKNQKNDKITMSKERKSFSQEEKITIRQDGR